jgi:hypothetical protein
MEDSGQSLLWKRLRAELNPFYGSINLNYGDFKSVRRVLEAFRWWKSKGSQFDCLWHGGC